MNTLFLFSQSPYQNALAREALDMALAFAAFGEQVSLVFLHNGVFQLIAQQESSIIQQKNISKTLQALAMYDINHIYVQEESLHEYALENTPLCIQPQAINQAQLQTLLSQADKVLSF